MSLNQSQAEAVLVNFYKAYLPVLLSYSSTNLDDYVSAMRISTKYMSVTQAFEKALGEAILTAHSFEKAFPALTITDSDWANPAQLVNRLSTTELVNFLYPNSNDKASLGGLVSGGTLTNAEFLYGASVAGVSASANQVVLGASVVTDKAYSGVVTLITSPLHFDGVSDAQLDFVVAMYASAFNRAPEYDGARYWANKLSVEFSHGASQTTAYSVISKQMYIDGKGNGEGGTTLSDSAYVSYAYQNILGRSGDASGVQYWNDKLTSGAVDRGSFVAQFVNDALANAYDANFLQARIAVSKFAAQEHVSGPSKLAGIDLRAVVQSVTDSASANNAINAMIQKYGTAASPHTVAGLLASWDEPANADAIHHDNSVATVELTGAVVAQSQDLFAV